MKSYIYIYIYIYIYMSKYINIKIYTNIERKIWRKRKKCMPAQKPKKAMSPGIHQGALAMAVKPARCR